MLKHRPVLGRQMDGGGVGNHLNLESQTESPANTKVSAYGRTRGEEPLEYDAAAQELMRSPRTRG